MSVRHQSAAHSGSVSKGDPKTASTVLSEILFNLQATLKRYQAEHRNKLDSLEKSQAELKKIRRKSQGGRNALKYEHKEIEVSVSAMSSSVNHKRTA